MVIASIYWLGPWRSHGERTVDTAIFKAELILKAPSYGFLKQIARVESHYGKATGTFDGKGGCGIWQVDPIALLDTKTTEAHQGLAKFHKRIQSALGLDWTTVKCSDLDYPLLGAIAARLFLLNNPNPIPDTLEGRAIYWKQYYNTKLGAGTVDDFLRANSGEM